MLLRIKTKHVRRVYAKFGEAAVPGALADAKPIQMQGHSATASHLAPQKKIGLS
jgi:hypothetical protein